jgi:deazaflavin-dependent oxidoreductase (nitroreductase family)
VDERRRSTEIEFFRTLNRLVEPAVRAGFASPCLAPGGLVVVETRGRRTGRLTRIPLAATRIQGHVLLGTFRGARSQWVRNLSAHPETRFWLGGRPRQARAFVLPAGEPVRPARDLPAALHWLAPFLSPNTRAGWAFAVLAPRDEGPDRRRRCECGPSSALPSG